MILEPAPVSRALPRRRSALALAALLCGAPALPAGEPTYDWKKEANQADAECGSWVGPAGDVNGDGHGDVIVGARRFDAGGLVDTGRVWVFHGKAGGLKNSPAWTYAPDEAGALAGTSAFTAGDVNGDGYSDVVIGIPGADAGGTDRGQVRVYYGSPTGIEDAGVTILDGASDGDGFGERVATAGDVNGDGFSDVIVGFDLVGDNGKATVHHGSAAGLVTTPAWSKSGARHFGYSVHTAGDVNADGYADVIVGVPGKTVNGVDDTGKVIVYHGSASGLESTAAWSLDGGQAGERYGNSAATAGDVNGDGYADVIVGATRFGGGKGRARIYSGGPSGISGQLWAFAGQIPSGRFGHSVFTAGDFNGDGYADVVVGAPELDLLLDGGRVFVFFGSSGGPSATPDWKYVVTDSVSRAGFRVATAGDVDGDGLSDIIVGDPTAFATQLHEGWAYVFRGCSSGPAEDAGWSVKGTQHLEEFGSAVAIAGDVNGDGYDDVLASAPSFDGPSSNEGRVVLYAGSPTGPSTTPLWSAEGDQVDALFGFSLATAGDVNGDGFDDVVVGAPKVSNTTGGLAFVRVHHGSPTGPSAAHDWEVVADVTNSRLGATVGSVGDLDGDGYGDVFLVDGWRGVVRVHHGSSGGLGPSPERVLDHASDLYLGAAPAGDVDGDGFTDLLVHGYRHADGKNRGFAELHLGGPTGLSGVAAWSKQGNDIRYGRGLGSAGDVNGDGFADVAIGSEDEKVGGLDVGRVFIFHGRATGLPSDPDLVLDGVEVGADFGEVVATAGDVDGDGFSDLLIGAPDHAAGEAYEGEAFLHLGSASGLDPTPAWTAESDTVFGFLGRGLSTAGDVNGDGYADVLVGVPGHHAGGQERGGVFLHYGNGRAGVSREVRVRRPDDAAPLPWRGASNDGAVRLRGRLHSPFGGGRVAIEVEVKPLGVPFDATGTTTGPFLANGQAFDETVADLAFGQPHRWRARPVYDRIGHPYQAAGRWTSPARAAASEAAFRTRTCEGAAAATGYGVGKPGTNGVPTLTSGPPVLGESVTLSIGNGFPGGSAHLFFGFSSAAIPFDDGSLWLVPAGSLAVPLDAAGGIDLPIELDATPAACGVSVFLQVLVPDPGALGFHGTAQSKGLSWTLGS